MAQASGSRAEIWYKIEQVNGVTPSADSVAYTTLASETGIYANEILKIGNDNNMEFVKVDSSYSSGTTVTLDVNTKINYRHESGEAVRETDPTGSWFKLGNVRSFTLSGGRELKRSQALRRTRVLSNFMGRELRHGSRYDSRGGHTYSRDVLPSHSQ